MKVKVTIFSIIVNGFYVNPRPRINILSIPGGFYVNPRIDMKSMSILGCTAFWY